MEEKPIEKNEEKKEETEEKPEEEISTENGSIIANRYKIYQYIDEGNYGKVYAVQDINDNDRIYAMKILIKEKTSKETINNFRHEIDILNILNSDENIYLPKLYYHYNPPENTIKRCYFVIDYAEKDCLFPYIKNANLEEKYLKIIFKKIVEGIKYCHSRNICHLDIKIENILLDSNYYPLITDFGFAQKIKDENGKIIQYYGKRGTRYSMCPQMFLDKMAYNGIEADIFSLGAILFLMINKFYGFKYALKNDKFYTYIYKKDSENYWKKMGLSDSLSKEFKELYFKIVAYKPGERPTIDEILNSPWLEELNILEENNNDAYQKLMLDYKSRMEDIFNKLVKANIINAVNTQGNDEGGPTHRGLIDDDIDQIFEKDIKIKNLSKNKMNLNYSIKIKGLLEPVNFMNLLVTKINKKYKDKILVEASKENLKCMLIFESDEEEQFEDLKIEQTDCVIKLKLYKAGDEEYVLHFWKKEGDIKDFYEYFLDIREIIEKILN